jgi:uncharacterized metal-binding protein YceD (DUF177 family)
LNNGKIKVVLEIDKQSRMMILDFSIKGFVTVDCDRCGYELELKIKDSKKIIVKYTNDGSDSEDIIFLDEKISLIDVSGMIYEFIILSLPMRRIHSKGKCDADQLKMLENLTKTTHHDPRWEVLKDLKLE